MTEVFLNEFNLNLSRFILRMTHYYFYVVNREEIQILSKIFQKLRAAEGVSVVKLVSYTGMPTTRLILNIISPFGDYLDWNNFTSLILIISYIPLEYYLRLAIASCGINPYQYLSKSKVIDFFTNLGNTISLKAFDKLYEQHDYNHDGRISFEELLSWYKDCSELFIDLDFIRTEFQSSFLGKTVSKRIINRKLEYSNIKSYKKHHYGHDPQIPCYISIINMMMRYPNPLHYDFDFTDEKTGETIMANCIREYLIEKYHIRSSHDIHSSFITKIRPDYKDNMMMMMMRGPFFGPMNNNNNNNNKKQLPINASVASSRRSIKTLSTSEYDNTSYSSKGDNNKGNDNKGNVGSNSGSSNGESFSNNCNNYTYISKFTPMSHSYMKTSQRTSHKTSDNTMKNVSENYTKKTISINDLPGMINSDSCSSSFK